ncbi:MAG: hypothetical protein V4695_09250 [Pseudomonadota bacterium]
MYAQPSRLASASVKQRQIPKRQRGVIVLFTMIAVVLLLIGSVALVRSFDTAQTLAGNMAFKRDLVNQAERGIARAVASVSPAGALEFDSVRQANSLDNNYSATTLASNSHGIPIILIDEAAWQASGMAGTDLVDSSTNIQIRYVIDRMCSAGGVSTTANCAISSLDIDKNGTNWIRRAGGGMLPVYRISVRVTGPRNTQTYVQSTVSM